MATIEHEDIKNRYHHEPKGIAAAVANDVFKADGAGSGSWGTAGDLPTAWQLISNNIPSASAVLTYSWDESLYSSIRVVFDEIRTDTDADTLTFRVGHTGGTVLAETAGNYQMHTNDMASPGLWVYSAATTVWELTNNDLGNVSTETASGRVILSGNLDTNLGVYVDADCLYQDTAGTHKYRWGKGIIGEFGGSVDWAGNPDTFQLRLASGAFITQGTVKLFGLRRGQ